MKIFTAKTAKNVRNGAQFFNNRKTLFRMLKEVFQGKYRMSFLTTVLLITGLIYIIMPFDFDWIPVIGWIDDAFIAYLLVKLLQYETKRFNRFKAMERKGL